MSAGSPAGIAEDNLVLASGEALAVQAARLAAVPAAAQAVALAWAADKREKAARAVARAGFASQVAPI